MKKIDGVQIGAHIFRYGDNVFQTNEGAMLKFTNGAEHLLGIWPGCSWDRFYDEVMIELGYPHINAMVLKQRRTVPVIISNDACPKCGNKGDYKFCSISCWFFYTIDIERDIIANAETMAKIERHVHFVQQMVRMFGQQVDAELLNLAQP